jgi:hypothetical protein
MRTWKEKKKRKCEEQKKGNDIEEKKEDGEIGRERKRERSRIR